MDTLETDGPNSGAACRPWTGARVGGGGMAVLVLFAVLQFGLATGAHADCVEADRLFQAASRAADPEPDLTRAVEICPDHANALNNLALLREGQGQLDEAERLYRRSIAAGGGAAPYAGLGDVQAARGEYTPAAQSYRQFLTLLREEVERGDPSGLGAYADAYKAKLAALPPEARAEAPVVSAEAVTRGLTRRPHLTRGLKVQHHAEPHIDVPILFETNSDVLTPRARTQVLEMARALKMPGLDRVRILVEGHTDDVGEDGYNLGLSERRARSVRHALVDLGVAADRLTAAGLGESRPIVPNSDNEARARNRRVTLVNLGAQ